ncbi:hemicentin-1-like [Anticarsia gemmatalis]|uniref:hemicentin-1-like n=1 Tax=Anticarsia gemmatalis TaxID=129554 RepID=UPI003F75E1AC
MWVWFYPHVIALIITNALNAVWADKGSLTFAIDNTLSMRDDIAQVKSSAAAITKIVFKEKASQIKNMVLVTFNDPYARLVTVTKKRSVLREKINAIRVHNKYGNRDCPEMSMTGILLALKKSLPGSYIYVFTDASAKDHARSREVKNLCQKKQTQIIFVLTGSCGRSRRNEPEFLVYNDIASACSGLAFTVDKQDVKKVLGTIKETIKGKQTVIASRTTPANVYTDISVIKLINPRPGTYTARVRGTTQTSLFIVGRTDFFFRHGFSELEPKMLKDTTKQPIANAKTHLSIHVVDPKHTVNIGKAQILDMNENVLQELQLKHLRKDFYTTKPFWAPSHRFKVAVVGTSKHTGKPIKRIATIPITPIDPPKVVPKRKMPVVTISEGSSIELKYGITVKLTCKVKAYPEPTIKWFNSRGTAITSLSSVMEPPYDYISYLTVSDVSNSDKYTCIATNNVGSRSKDIQVTVEDPFNVKSIVTGTTELHYGIQSTLKCDITAIVPMEISWSFMDEKTGTNHHVTTSSKYSISSDGTELTINKMDPDMVGSYTCKATLIKDKNKSVEYSTQVKIIGMEPPKVTGVNEETVIKGTDFDLECRTSGVPPPTISWQFMSKDSSRYVSVAGSDNVLRISRVDEKHAGRYKCIAHNVVGDDEHVTTLTVQVPPKIVSSTSTVYKSTEDKDTQLTIPCEATGLPKPDITWKKNGATILTNTKYLIQDGALVIRNPVVSDSHTYTCEAKNNAGADQATFRANIMQIPRVSGLDVKVIKRGDYVNIECEIIKGVPKPTISWQFMEDDTPWYVSVAGSDNVLRISRVDEKHAGRYKCIAHNVVGDDEHVTTLTVQVPPEIALSSQKTYKSIEGRDEELRIPCAATGNPKPLITWKANGVIINPSTKYLIQDGALVIRDPKVSDSHTYTCEAKNNAGADQATFQVNIMQLPDVPDNDAMTTVKGNPINIECRIVKGVPKPTITWQFMAEDSSRYVSVAGSDNVLRISRVDEKHAGRYKCIAHNVVGDDEHVTTLTVQVPPEILSNAELVYKGVQGRDEQLRIPCTVAGNPKPVITWKVKGVTISESRKYSLLNGVLVIRDLKVSDSQAYTCEAKNNAGSVQASFQVNILRVPEVYGKTALTIVKGKSADFECRVVGGVPQPTIRWQFMSKDSSRYVSVPGSDNVLRISRVDEKHAGRYKCIAHNVVGDDEHVTTLTVQVPPKILSSTSDTKVYTSIEGKDTQLRIPCEATGLPKPDITWKKNGVTILTGTKYLIQDGALVIRDPQVSDSHTYTCEAKNNAGADQANFQTNIMQLPDVPQNDAVTTVKGKSINIDCRIVKGVPKPTITWQFMSKDSSRYVSVAGSDNVLRISRVDEKHAGRYKCIAHNVVGDDEHVTTLTVQGAKYMIQDEVLVIRDPKVSDSQTYSCEAKNDAGSVEETFRVNIMQLPEILGSSTVTTIKSNPTSIECRIVKGVPKPTITWQFMSKDSSRYVSVAGSDNVLRISRVDEKHAGRYKCIAHNVVGDDEHVTTLTVQVPPKILSSTSKVYTSIEGRDTQLIIPCEATGFPKPEIMWKNNGATILTSTKYLIQDGALVIRDPKVSDSHTYLCEAKNNAGADQATFQAYVMQLPDVPENDAQTTIKGQTTNIDCRIVKGVPKPKITWQFMSKDSSRYVSVAGSDNVLRISRVDEKHAGRYKCIAHNVVGDDEHVTTLTVQVPPKILSSTSKVYTSIEGRDTKMTIPCKATGFPKPEIAWKNNGVTILTSTKYLIQDGALVIRDPKVSDSHTYTCEAKNNAGADQATFQVNIMQLPDVPEDDTKTTVLGKSINIECRILKGVPKPTITWQFMSKDSSRYVSVAGSDNVLRISRVDEKHAGRYKCIAHNVVGDDEHVTTLTVEFAPVITSKHSATYKGLEGDVALKIPCDVVGVPPPAITWKRNGVVITPNNHYDINNGALIIKSPKKSDTSSYTCVAKNNQGAVDATFNATVDEYLDDLGKIQEVNLLHGDTMKLKCGSDSQLVRWFMERNDLGVTGKYFELKNIDVSQEGNYTCRVSDMNGGHTETFVVHVGLPPTFLTEQENTRFDWTGSETDMLDCRVEAQPAVDVVWTYNGKVLSDKKTTRLAVSGNWGQYTCNVSNVHGAVQRSFDVISSHCLIPRKPKYGGIMPLILTTHYTWPLLNGTTDYIMVGPGQTHRFVCLEQEGQKNNFRKLPRKSIITGTCKEQDTFVVEGIPTRVTDLQCVNEINPTVVEKNVQCLTKDSRLMRVTFYVHGFLETYEVCFDTSRNIPLYTRVAMSKSNLGPGVTGNWYKYPGIGDDTARKPYTCATPTSSCCYSKAQLVNARDFIDGPAQDATYIDPINAVPYWRPCDSKKSPWEEIENMVRSRLQVYPQFVAWSGTHALQDKNGAAVPRYLWKVLRFNEASSIAIVYVNGASPSAADYLCKNICADDNVPWIHTHNKHVYCCNVDDFLQAFGLRGTSIGESTAVAFNKIRSKGY